jgi:hypothetical protein
MKLRRLRKENIGLRRALARYEEVIRPLALENDAPRQGATVVPLPARPNLPLDHSPDPGPSGSAQRVRAAGTA